MKLCFTVDVKQYGSSRGAEVECGTCNPKVVGSNPALSKVPSFACSKNCGPRQGRVRQLALRASLESVGDSDHERVAWSLYKREVPPVCIPRATRRQRGEMNIPTHSGYTGPCNNLSQTGRGGFSA